ncbi:MAG TPA: hypothetical protein VNA25_19255, partial [Phycisphaerae bacterium]|nr:hypothetical protein [Phycisphaerae bacterium]
QTFLSAQPPKGGFSLRNECGNQKPQPEGHLGGADIPVCPAARKAVSSKKKVISHPQQVIH